MEYSSTFLEECSPNLTSIYTTPNNYFLYHSVHHGVPGHKTMHWISTDVYLMVNMAMAGQRGLVLCCEEACDMAGNSVITFCAP